MRVTTLTRQVLAFRKQRRDLRARGYEELGEGGGMIWQLYRGSRTRHRIVDAIIGVDGKRVYVRCEEVKNISLA